MGKKSDPNAVVDTRGRVYGVEGLRIVDASIFPLLPAGHPMSTICKLCRLGSRSKRHTDCCRCSSGTHFGRHLIRIRCGRHTIGLVKGTGSLMEEPINTIRRDYLDLESGFSSHGS